VVGRLCPSSGDVVEYPLPTPHSEPYAITAGPDGNMWFTESGKIGRITPSGTITEFSLPSATSAPTGIAAGPDGNLWFAEIEKIGRITTTGTITEFSVTGAGLIHPFLITRGPAGDPHMWFTDQFAGAIGSIHI
jgi:streptogramin lyase